VLIASIFSGILALFGLGGAPAKPAVPLPPTTYLVRASTISDQKSVFATVESAYVVPARVRTGGTILELKVRQGDHVDQGQVIAIVGDQKLALTVNSYAAQVQAARAQLAQAQLEYARAQRLIAAGAIARSLYDQSHTALSVAQSNLTSIQAQRAVVQEQETQGQVLAPTAGRVITVPVTAGTVVMGGDIVATVAEQDFVLRLQIPERHARYLKVGEPVRLDGADLGLSGPRFGTIRLIYPLVDNGHVVADASVPGLTDYFVGQRVRVWIPAGARTAIVVPEKLITTRFGIDYARLWTRGDGAFDVPVQRGEAAPSPAMPDGLEILSGLKSGDRLLAP
jgi:RND family efflux transporter MFP subunit